MRPGLPHHPAQLLRVLQHGAGPQHVVVEGLAVVVGHEEGALEGLQQGHVPDVHVGVVDEHAGLHVPGGADVEVPPPPGDAPAHILRVVLEVHGEDGLGLPVGADAAVHLRALLRGWQQAGRGPPAHRHVVEVPDEQRPPVDHLVEVGLAGHVGKIGAGVAGGDAEGQAVGLQQLHGPDHLFIDAAAPAAVGGGLKALHAQCGDKVFYPQHIPAELLVHQRAVGEGEELAVRVALAQRQHILFPHQGLAAGEDVHVGPQLLPLADDTVHLLQGQVQLPAVLRRPAAGAVQVAGAGGVQQDGPGDIAPLPPGGVLLYAGAHQAGVDQEVLEEGPAHARVQPEDAHHQPVPVAFRLQGRAHRRALGDIPAVGGEFVHHVHHLQGVGLRVLLQVVQRLLEGGGKGRAL